jgi:hypothetical protein
MQSYDIDGVTFTYNEDFSGNVTISSDVIPTESLGNGVVVIPASSLIEFIADAYVRPFMVKSIEQTPAEDLLKQMLESDPL